MIGTLNNCAGGKTPWGTVLTGEENFNVYFAGDAAKRPKAAPSSATASTGTTAYAWGAAFRPLRLDKEPNEPNRFGWIVEIDPYDPTIAPVKRTALGRFKHEGATTAVDQGRPRGRLHAATTRRRIRLQVRDGAGPSNPSDRAANRDLLDEGTLYVARFEDDGTLRWLPLVHGQGPLTAANGFASQADVLIERARRRPARRHADGPAGGHRGEPGHRQRLRHAHQQRARAAPAGRTRPTRAPTNTHGHIIEIDPAATGRRPTTPRPGSWEIFMLAGNPGEPPQARDVSTGLIGQRLAACPDNVAFDQQGPPLDRDRRRRSCAGIADGLFAATSQGRGGH